MVPEKSVPFLKHRYDVNGFLLSKTRNFGIFGGDFPVDFHGSS
jgi:hypothetical protein